MTGGFSLQCMHPPQSPSRVCSPAIAVTVPPSLRASKPGTAKRYAVGATSSRLMPVLPFNYGTGEPLFRNAVVASLLLAHFNSGTTPHCVSSIMPHPPLATYIMPTAMHPSISPIFLWLNFCVHYSGEWHSTPLPGVSLAQLVEHLPSYGRGPGFDSRRRPRFGGRQVCHREIVNTNPPDGPSKLHDLGTAIGMPFMSVAFPVSQPGPDFNSREKEPENHPTVTDRTPGTRTQGQSQCCAC